MSDKNKFGLSRTIDAETKRAIRRDAGFGCVICGSAIIEYEHIDPPFSECSRHDPDFMTVLCPTCHSKKTKGLLSLERVWEAKKKPRAKQQGFSNDFWDMGQNIPTVCVGPLTAVDCDNILTICGRPVISIREPEEFGAPVRFNADILSPEGLPIFTVVDNEWRCNAANWDVEQIGSKLVIREALGKKVLELQTTPQREVRFNLIDLHTSGYYLRGDSKEFYVEFNSFVIRLESATITGWQHAIILGDEPNSMAIGKNAGGKNRKQTVSTGPMMVGGPPRVRKKMSMAAPLPPKRIAVCPCGSGKRFKHCCGRI